MSSSNNQSNSGIGVVGMTFIVFLVLKLCGVIDWSWWWITAPLWMSTAVLVLMLLVIGIAFVIKR